MEILVLSLAASTENVSFVLYFFFRRAILFLPGQILAVCLFGKPKENLTQATQSSSYSYGLYLKNGRKQAFSSPFSEYCSTAGFIQGLRDPWDCH